MERCKQPHVAQDMTQDSPVHVAAVPPVGAWASWWIRAAARRKAAEAEAMRQAEVEAMREGEGDAKPKAEAEAMRKAEVATNRVQLPTWWIEAAARRKTEVEARREAEAEAMCEAEEEASGRPSFQRGCGENVT
jgi:hypothetical protein